MKPKIYSKRQNKNYHYRASARATETQTEKVMRICGFKLDHNKSYIKQKNTLPKGISQ